MKDCVFCGAMISAGQSDACAACLKRFDARDLAEAPARRAIERQCSERMAAGRRYEALGDEWVRVLFGGRPC